VIVYFDPSAPARAYLVDEPGHDQATSLLADLKVALIADIWTRIELSGALACWRVRPGPGKVTRRPSWRCSTGIWEGTVRRLVVAAD
jgi:hypothetical protein